MIRRAEDRDISRILELLSQVLEVHAKIRPDVFVSGTTKYSAEELEEMIRDEDKPIYVFDSEGTVQGYAFCQIKEPPFTSTMIPRKILFIDDLCVDESARGSHVGRNLFEFVKEEAKRIGCNEILLNVWEGNDVATRFYESMGMKPRETQMEFML